MFDEENIGDMKNNDNAGYEIPQNDPDESVNIHISSNNFKFIRSKSAMPMSRGKGGLRNQRKPKTANG